MSAEDVTPDALQPWRLADGAEVPKAIVVNTLLSLTDLLEKFGPVAAIDLIDIASGNQPAITPLGDPKEIYPATGLVEVSGDGKLHMHELVRDVVRNAVHTDPNNAFRFSFNDPREPFYGFDR
jgi:hypothetical protein